jgi:hypothetical protein
MFCPQRKKSRFHTCRNQDIMFYTVFIVQAYQTSQYVVPCGGIFLGKWCSSFAGSSETSQYVVPCSGIFVVKWRSSFAGSSDGKMNVQSACALNTRYILILNVLERLFNHVLQQQSLCNVWWLSD